MVKEKRGINRVNSRGISSEGGRGVSTTLKAVDVEPRQWWRKRKWRTGHGSIDDSDSGGCGGAVESVVRDVVVVLRPRQPCRRYCLVSTALHCSAPFALAWPSTRNLRRTGH
jgi:hypothetical protein